MFYDFLFTCSTLADVFHQRIWADSKQEAINKFKEEWVVATIISVNPTDYDLL